MSDHATVKDIGGFNSSRSLMEMDDASGPSDGALSGSSAGQRVADLMESTNAYTHLSADKEEVAERERKASWATPTNVRKMWPRPWAEGDVYAPHDLSRVEAAKWRKIRPVEMDRVDQLGINPLDHYKVRLYIPRAWGHKDRKRERERAEVWVPD